MPTYERAPDSCQDLIDETLAAYYPDLVEAEVTVGSLFAFATTTEDGEKVGPAVKLHGYPCAATIKVNSTRDRVEGKPDATITVDGDQWPGWTDEERRALIDHELYHLELKRDRESGELLADDAGRPRMKCKLHDFQYGGFEAVARRHGAASFEVQQGRALADKYGQLLFSWGDQKQPEEHRVKKPAKTKAEAVASR